VRLLARAPLRDVLGGRAPLGGARCDEAAARGWVSPVEARVHLGIPYGDLAAEEAALLARRSWRSDVRALATAALTAPLASPHAAAERRPFVVSSRVDALSIGEAVEALASPHRSPSARVVHFVHPHALNLAWRRPALAALLASADLVLPDGIGLRIGARLVGAPLEHNLNGTDMLPLLCQAMARVGRPLVLIGAAPGVAEAAGEKLRGATPGLRIPIVSDGFADEPARQRLVERVEQIGPCTVLVGMGTPLQEEFARRYLAHLAGCTVVTVGGLFDFYAERVPRAPLLWRELGLEWLFRLLQEPTRLAGRYLLGNPLFLGLSTLQRLTARSAP
jgi:N-acetylglucosaminyldiphosphoundecaprenol N-acetyl-beta-D-mannosaminyltransferase